MKRAKKNCWEFFNCGREPGGAKVSQLKVCPAAIDKSSDGKNGGMNAGRYCWRIAGTFCNSKVQGTFAAKIPECSKCDFYKRVREDEGPDHQI